MEDEEVGEEGSLSLGHHFQEVALYLSGVAFMAQAKPLRETPHVGVHNHALLPTEGIAQDHVGGLTSHPRKPDEFVHGRGNLPFMILDEGAGHILYEARLDAEETYRPYLFLKAP